MVRGSTFYRYASLRILICHTCITDLDVTWQSPSKSCSSVLFISLVHQFCSPIPFTKSCLPVPSICSLICSHIDLANLLEASVCDHLEVCVQVFVFGPSSSGCVISSSSGCCVVVFKWLCVVRLQVGVCGHLQVVCIQDSKLLFTGMHQGLSYASRSIKHMANR